MVRVWTPGYVPSCHDGRRGNPSETETDEEEPVPGTPYSLGPEGPGRRVRQSKELTRSGALLLSPWGNLCGICI